MNSQGGTGVDDTNIVEIMTKNMFLVWNQYLRNIYLSFFSFIVFTAGKNTCLGHEKQIKIVGVISIRIKKK